MSVNMLKSRLSGVNELAKERIATIESKLEQGVSRQVGHATALLSQSAFSKNKAGKEPSLLERARILTYVCKAFVSNDGLSPGAKVLERQETEWEVVHQRGAHILEKAKLVDDKLKEAGDRWEKATQAQSFLLSQLVPLGTEVAEEIGNIHERIGDIQASIHETEAVYIKAVENKMRKECAKKVIDADREVEAYSKQKQKELENLEKHLAEKKERHEQYTMECKREHYEKEFSRQLSSFKEGKGSSRSSDRHRSKESRSERRSHHRSHRTRRHGDEEGSSRAATSRSHRRKDNGDIGNVVLTMGNGSDGELEKFLDYSSENSASERGDETGHEETSD